VSASCRATEKVDFDKAHVVVASVVRHSRRRQEKPQRQLIAPIALRKRRG
jgi:hypothetical protein